MLATETTFAQRLDLVLRALSISRGRLASEIGVDKSLVSRWLSGGARPSSHNLERVTRLVGAYRPGFSMLDWDRDLGALGRVVGLTDGDAPPGPVAAPPSTLPSGPQWSPGRLPFGSLAAAAIETERRASAYVGRWKVTRLTSSGAMTALVEYALILPDGPGLSIEHLFPTHSVRGWMIVYNGVLYAFAADSGDDSFASYCLNGVVGPRAHVLDGIVTSVGGSRRLVPFSQVIVLEREGDLEGEAADAAWAEAAMGRWGAIDLAALKPEIREAISRDFGAGEAAKGGDAILRIPNDRSLAKGVY